MAENNTANDTPSNYTKEAFEVAKFIGIVGFGAGFIGPLIVHPGSNQGPLFGIIISGPLSFIYGMFNWRSTSNILSIQEGKIRHT